MAEKTVTFSVDDMHCRSCGLLVDMTAGELDGVSAVETDVPAGTSVITFDDAVTDTESIAAAITAVGHPASVLSE